IIDAKYYSHMTQVQYGKHTLHSNNIYQIFAYVKNQDVGNTGNVSGLLLYAKTDEEITPDMDVIMSGNKISAKTLDLNCDFATISSQLKRIVKDYFVEHNSSLVRKKETE
ncbi:MAG: 5-methylcytosine-specific restriction endonuclease system specificity protein McrC, partial [Firmicutes bacterium]|nr:5-methylcytosine-specific restriction endonuclease system specificity protein McrC [Bacillota bacterium]